MTAVTFAEPAAPLPGRRGGPGPVEAWCERYAQLVARPRCSVHAQRAVLCAIARVVDEHGQGAYVANGGDRSRARVSLVKLSRYSRSTVIRAVDALAGQGAVIKTPVPGRGTANRFVVVIGPRPLTAAEEARGDERMAAEDPPPLGVLRAALSSPAGPSRRDHRDTRSGPVEHAVVRTVTPQVVDLGVVRELPARADENEPATPGLVAGVAASGAAEVLGWPEPAMCSRAVARGRRCTNCRSCGTSPGAVRARTAAMQRALDLRARGGPRFARCAGCGWAANTRLLDADLRCADCRSSGWENPRLDGDGAGQGALLPPAGHDAQDGPSPGRWGPYGPGAGS